MKDSEVLKQVRRKIASGREKYICYAISSCKRAPLSQKRLLRAWVAKMLNWYGSYEGWVYNTLPTNKLRPRTPREFREGRLQWLDWMIAECEKEESK